ncbi:MAG: AraC family transcriptional regulator [Mucilaginibacter sp.]|uniref:helix-turn-helix domain-containing protein n=1 Tax=Mucilaginibacter sp. TaxID=1882438 RepID=UPI0031A3FD81
MLYRFPHNPPSAGDPTWLTGETQVFAKLKIESQAGKKTIFLASDTLIFVINGVKLLHLSDRTIEVTSDKVFLLKKGIYVMAEFLESISSSYEALMIFLPEKILKEFTSGPPKRGAGSFFNPCLVFPLTPLIQDFKLQFRRYFEYSVCDYDRLMPHKQREILTLLLATGYQHDIQQFINSAAGVSDSSMDYIVQNYLLQPVTIAELARLCNRSLASFKRDFRDRYQMSPRAFINQYRLNHARTLLQNSNQSVMEIAATCAFENPSYFSKAFKRAFGVSPQEIRSKKNKS